MTTTASGRLTRLMMAGAPGFEPGIAGPKPAALPLGYAPGIQAVSLTTVEKDQEERNSGEQPGEHEHEQADEVREQDRDDRQRL